MLTLETLRLLLAGPFAATAWDRVTGTHLHVRIGNAPPVIRRDEALAAIEQLFARIEGMGHGFWYGCADREALFAECDLRFHDAAGRGQTIPCAVVARLAGGALIDLRLHLDPAPIP
ncbi:MAG: hypothetical protein K2X76_13120 [Sphingomonas sp.]|nr:hypothetical protein [Sphingomonas sp.]